MNWNLNIEIFGTFTIELELDGTSWPKTADGKPQPHLLDGVAIKAAVPDQVWTMDEDTLVSFENVGFVAATVSKAFPGRESFVDRIVQDMVAELSQELPEGIEVSIERTPTYEQAAA